MGVIPVHLKVKNKCKLSFCKIVLYRLKKSYRMMFVLKECPYGVSVKRWILT